MQRTVESPRVFVFRKGLISDRDDARESHFHQLYEIFLVRRGSFRVQIGNRECIAYEGHLCIIPKGVMHKTIYGGEESERDVIQFSLDYINPSIGAKLYRFFPNNVFGASDDECSHFLEEIFARIERESELNDEYTDEMYKSYINQLFAYILRRPQYQSRLRMDGIRVTSQGINETVHYIAAHYNEPLTLEMLARRASVSTSHYSRSFREATGYGFKEYLNMIRIGEARRLLLGTDESICNVAYACGFNDSNYFSTCFKSIHGESPVAFRRRHRKEERLSGHDHRAYVQDPTGSKHSVLRITSNRGEAVPGSKTANTIAVSAEDVPHKQVSFRVYLPSRRQNRMIGDFFTDAGFQTLYQLYVTTGPDSMGHSGQLFMLSVVAVGDQKKGGSITRFTRVRGFDIVVCSSERDRIRQDDIHEENVLDLDTWHDITLDFDFSDRTQPLCTLSVDGIIRETTHLFYIYPDGLHYDPKGAVSLQIGTLMRTCGTIYFDAMRYTESGGLLEIRT